MTRAFSAPPGLTSGIASSMLPSMATSWKAEKVRENRLRRMAERQGLRLEKSRRRDPRAVDYGTYQLVDPATNTLVSYGLGGGYGLNLDEIEHALNE